MLKRFVMTGPVDLRITYRHGAVHNALGIDQDYAYQIAEAAMATMAASITRITMSNHSTVLVLK